MNDPEHRIQALEDRIAALESVIETLRPSSSTLPPPPTAEPQPPPPTGPPVAMHQPTAPATSTPHRSPALTVDSETLLKWGGVGLVVLAVGFGVSTAIQRGWIGPTLQLIGALALALGLIGLGIRVEPVRRGWAHALCSGGVAALFVTFASDLFLDQANTDVAYSLTFISGLLGLAVARRIDSEWVGAVTLLGGLIGWLVIGEGEPPFTESGAALVAALVVLTAVGVERQWFGLRSLTHAVGMGCAVALAVSAETGFEHTAALVAAALVALGLAVVPSLGDDTPVWRHVELHLPTLLGPFVWIVLAESFLDEFETAAGLVALGVAAGVGALALTLRDRLVAAHAAALLVGASISLTIGLGMVLSTDIAWLAIAVQGAGLLVLRRVVPDAWLFFLNAGVLLFAATVSVVIGSEAAWFDDASIGDDLARLGVIVTIAAAGWIAQRVEARQVVGFAVLGLTLLWLGSVLIHLPQGQAIVSLSWAVVGVAILVTGAIRKIPDLGNVGLVVLALTVGKLLLVDMAEVDALWRAGLFLAVGVALLRLGFLLPIWTAAGASRADEG